MRQVDCTPPGNIVIDVVKARATAGGFIQFALEQVAPSPPPLPLPPQHYHESSLLATTTKQESCIMIHLVLPGSN